MAAFPTLQVTDLRQHAALLHQQQLVEIVVPVRADLPVVLGQRLFKRGDMEIVQGIRGRRLSIQKKCGTSVIALATSLWKPT
jgi:hypothetical protein